MRCRLCQPREQVLDGAGPENIVELRSVRQEKTHALDLEVIEPPSLVDFVELVQHRRTPSFGYELNRDVNGPAGLGSPCCGPLGGRPFFRTCRLRLRELKQNLFAFVERDLAAIRTLDTCLEKSKIPLAL